MLVSPRASSARSSGGRANASIASLQRIAGALGVSVADLFSPDGARSRPRVLQRESRPMLGLGTRGRKFLLTPRPLEHLEVFIGELDPGGATADEPFTHGNSEELVIVLSGSIQLQLGTDVHGSRRATASTTRARSRTGWSMPATRPRR